jgi:hypothetical protein
LHPKPGNTISTYELPRKSQMTSYFKLHRKLLTAFVYVLLPVRTRQHFSRHSSKKNVDVDGSKLSTMADEGINTVTRKQNNGFPYPTLNSVNKHNMPCL